MSGFFGRQKNSLQGLVEIEFNTAEKPRSYIFVVSFAEVFAKLMVKARNGHTYIISPFLCHNSGIEGDKAGI